MTRHPGRWPALLVTRLLVTGLVTGLVLTGIVGCAGAPVPGTPGAAPSVPIGSSAGTVAVGTATRSFRIHRPPPGPPGPMPLVVMLHGGGGTAAAAERSYGWDAEADREHFTVVYPDGVNRVWSVGGGCCAAPGRAADDVGFIEQLVATVRRELPIDPDRVYASGISEGGMMSYRLACATDLFAAVGPDSATLLGDCAAPAPLSVIHIHGTADGRIRYDGGAGFGVHHIDGPAVPALNATWRAVDRCPAPVVTAAGAITTSVASCPDGRGVELVTITGAGHQWPGKACTARCDRDRVDRPSTALDATDTIWRFFVAHPRHP